MPGRVLAWNFDVGAGFLGYHDPAIYNRSYLAEYERRAATEAGRWITTMRADFVTQFLPKVRWGEVVDVGSAAGQFVEHTGCLGYDVNAAVVERLQSSGQWFDIAKTNIETACFWDSLEHMPEPAEILRNVRGYAFVSTPIYKDIADVFESHHFKPGEHLHYWTAGGLLHYMRHLGFDCLAVEAFEVRAGRRGVNSFAFRRMGYLV